MRDNVSQYVIKPLLEALESGNLPFWTKSWKTRDGMPLNGSTGKNYRGGNRFMLMIVSKLTGKGSDPRWLGMSQANKIGLKVRKGEKGTLVWIPLMVKDKESGDEKLVGFKYGHVFHATQFEGDLSKMIPIELRNLPNSPIPACEEFVQRLHPKMMTGVACSYCPQTDTVCMPSITAFDSSQAYYRSLLHEVGHWTGAEERCNREKSGGRVNREAYGFEELVAEIFSLFACYELGLEIDKDIPDAAAYCAGWMKSLKENPNWIPMAAEKAEQAMKFCLKGRIEVEQHEEIAEVA